jgi:hypothetical protein
MNLGKEHGEFTAAVFLCKQATFVCPVKRRFFISLFLQHTHYREENLYIFFAPLRLYGKKKFGKKILEGNLTPPPFVYPESYACEYCRCLRRDSGRSHVV